MGRAGQGCFACPAFVLQRGEGSGQLPGDRTMAVNVLDRYMWNHLEDGHI